MPKLGISDALFQYLRDIAPGGDLNPEVTPQGIMDTAAVATTPVPGLGDLAGLIADLNRYRIEPKARTPGNFALTGIGLLPLIPSLTVWHGSPHRFAPTAKNPLGEFSPQHIGTGEGAQAYGYGHYVAERPEVAKSYQVLNGPAGQGAAQYDLVQLAMRKSNGDRTAARAMINEWAQAEKSAWSRQQYNDAYNNFNNLLDSPPGALYKSDLADDAIPKMLDWDKPLSQQPEILKKLDETFGDYAMLLDRFGLSPKSSGGELYGLLSGAGLAKQPAASQKLSEIGIPGIRYLDQGSRGAGAGTHNYVVFPGNEGLLKILERK